MKCSLSANSETPTGSLSFHIAYTKTHTYALVAVTQKVAVRQKEHAASDSSLHADGFIWI